MTKEKTSTIGITVRIPIEYKESLDKISREEDRTISQIIRAALKLYLETKEKE